MQIKVLGSGCRKCQTLEKQVHQVVAEQGIEAVVEHVTDFREIASYGVMSTPALVVDDRVVSSGQQLSVTTLRKLLVELVEGGSNV